MILQTVCGVRPAAKALKSLNSPCCDPPVSASGGEGRRESLWSFLNLLSSLSFPCCYTSNKWAISAPVKLLLPVSTASCPTETTISIYPLEFLHKCIPGPLLKHIATLQVKRGKAGFRAQTGSVNPRRSRSNPTTRGLLSTGSGGFRLSGCIACFRGNGIRTEKRSGEVQITETQDMDGAVYNVKQTPCFYVEL